MSVQPIAPVPVSTASRRMQGERLSHLEPTVWRGLIRATRSARRLPALESEVVVLRGLEDAGLVRRRRSPEDRRSVLVEATARGCGVFTAFATDRVRVLLEAVDASDRSAITAALPALSRLTRDLDSLAEPGPAVGSSGARSSRG